KPQDIVVLLKLVALGTNEWSFASLAADLYMSPSEVHAGIKRATASRLFDESRKMPIRKNLEEFLVHGVKYAYPPQHGSLTRGIPTGYAAYPIVEMLTASKNDIPPVWPHPEGEVRGYEFSPLYKSAPSAVLKDKDLYALLALVDAIRDGRARERELAINELNKRLDNEP
ncbi:hypothetical protein JZU71_05255, partial [bacterium]|nr:hypothetical protein [bacterium]